MTYEEVTEKWKTLADRNSVAVMLREIPTFLEEAQESGRTLNQLIAAQERILNIWYAVSWKAAQEEHPYWKDKGYYDMGKKSLQRVFAKTLKELFADEVHKPAKTQPAPSPKEHRAAPKLKVVGSSYSSPAEDEYYSQFEVFTTHRQVKEHTQEYLDKIRRELTK